MSIIEANNLIRDYEYYLKGPGVKGSLKAFFKKNKQKKRAVYNFSFSANKNESIGLIGPNGAGKTTLIKMMAGIIKPTSGTLSVCDHIPSQLKNSFKKRISIVMGQKSQLWWDLPAIDTFYLNKALYDISDADFNQRLKDLLKLFSVEGVLNIQVRKLSLGQRMKMELIAALLHKPELIFLDEPTIGLDSCAQKNFRDLLKDINKAADLSVILTSHNMEDIKSICDRIIVINEGKKIFDGSYAKLMAFNVDYKIVNIEFENKPDITQFAKEEIIAHNAYTVTLKIKKKNINEFTESMFERYEINDINIENEELSNVIGKIYSGLNNERKN